MQWKCSFLNFLNYDDHRPMGTCHAELDVVHEERKVSSQFPAPRSLIIYLSRSPSPRDTKSPVRGHRSRSRSLSRSRRSRSRSRDSIDVSNPGNNLYVTGLSTRITNSDLENYFGKEGKVVDCHLVTDPRSKESRGFGFVTMETNEDAERCIKYLNRSVFEGRLITVEKAKRKRGRTPTPGKYHGLRDKRGRDWRRSRSQSPRHWPERDNYSKDRRGRSRSPYSRRTDDYSTSYRRRRERSLSAGDSRYPR
ncbi:serine/arginine-rich splicing factor SR45a-like [Senna tora]|uniref:Serine/arginine-rich splicing factor SR45a-like n=1 Tax=Senna tora TaxID=362788 RepID=A0A834WQN1_9FABA|nr:serine/arginine-rich splicing factor SR45a-like [Senna tora]